MTRRYYVPELLNQHPHVDLPEDEALHAVRVMRMGVGDELELFDGRGHQALGTVTSVTRRDCVCQCEAPQFVDREPSHRLELAIALPKPDRAKELIERLTELGVSRILPLTFERTQRPPTAALIEKLQRIVIEACKQSGRNRLMTIDPVLTFAQFVTIQREIPAVANAMRMVAMPGGQAMLPPAIERGNVSLQCTIGPEGGLTEKELQQCVDLGADPIDLGKRILRIETAACVVASRWLID